MAGKQIKPQVFKCESCGANLEVSAPGYSSLIVCPKCLSSIDITHPLPKLIEKYEGALKYTPEIPLGSFGVIKGIKWKVIGFMVRKDLTYDFSWSEYLLFNPYHGFRFLLDIDSYYSLGQALDYPVLQKLGKTTDIQIPEYKNNFRLYNRGRAEVIYVVGEFYWQAQIGDRVSMEDFISPPYVLSVEKIETEVSNSVSEFIEHSEIKKAFAHVPGLTLTTPWKASANQPNPYQKNYAAIMKTWSVSVTAIVVVFFFFLISKKELPVTSFNLEDGDFNNTQKEFISPAFDLPDSYGNIELKLDSNVSNHWLSANVSLINEVTGEDYTAETGVEYYSGYDDEGSWSEGSMYSSHLLSGIPGGKYHAEISADTDMPSKKLRLAISRNSSMWLNFWIALFGVCIYPLWTIWRHRAFEISRWDDSDFSPYAKGESND